MKSMLKKSKVAVVIYMGVAMLAGCLSTTTDNPYVNDRRVNPDYEKYNNKSEQLRVSYIGRALMSNSDKENLTRKLGEEKTYEGWNPSTTAMVAQGAIDLTVGSFGSNVGVTVGSAIVLAGAVLDFIYDGSVDYVTLAHLPATFYGDELTSAEEAGDALRKYGHESIMRVAKQNGFSAECIERCDLGNRIYELTPMQPVMPKSKDLSKYVPLDKFYISTMFGDMKESKNPMLNAALGFEAKWISASRNGYNFIMIAKPTRNPDGSLKISGEKIKYINGREGVAQTSFGRVLLNQLYDNPFMFHGNANIYPKQAYYNGEKYTWSSTSVTGFMRYKIVE